MFCDDTRVTTKIDSEEDVEAFQNDLNKIYKWAEENNMLFNNDKFELLRYGCNENIKESTFYISANDEVIEEKEVLRDLGIIVNNNADFNDHVEHICSKVKQKSGWIFRTFKNRKPYFLKVLWKQLVQPHFDYCSQLMNLNFRNLQKLENCQRYFTRKISQQRRMERYKIIYV